MKARHQIMRGKVWHRRYAPTEHGFSTTINMVLTDLDDESGLFASHWSLGRRWRPLTLRRRDFVDHRDLSIADKVRDKAARLGMDFNGGSIQMLAQLRGLGWQFNPLVLYGHIPSGASRPVALLAEVRNTPWGERHWYALKTDTNGALTFFRHAKGFHVSPFLPMDMQYQWELDWSDPLRLRLGVQRDGDTVFEAGLRLCAEPVSGIGLFHRLPALLMQGLRTSAGIYWQAFRLWRKRVPVYRHPEKPVREGGH